METLTEQAEKRGCYCGVWDKDPKVYEDLGYERGYCGTCDRCGKPGHTRPYPALFHSPVAGVTNITA